jgi:hypothetical protein
MGNAIAGQRNGNCDERNTGHNYDADVMARTAMFEKLMAQPVATVASVVPTAPSPTGFHIQP